MNNPNYRAKITKMFYIIIIFISLVGYSYQIKSMDQNILNQNLVDENIPRSNNLLETPIWITQNQTVSNQSMIIHWHPAQGAETYTIHFETMNYFNASITESETWVHFVHGKNIKDLQITLPLILP